MSTERVTFLPIRYKHNSLCISCEVLAVQVAALPHHNGHAEINCCSKLECRIKAADMAIECVESYDNKASA